MRIVVTSLLTLVAGFVAGVALSERVKDAIWRLVVRLNLGKPK